MCVCDSSCLYISISGNSQGYLLSKEQEYLQTFAYGKLNQPGGGGGGGGGGGDSVHICDIAMIMGIVIKREMGANFNL